MKINNILITGASGLLGGNLCYLYNLKGIGVTGVYHKQQVSIPGVDMISIQKISEVQTKYDCIIHCAAMTNMDECEKNYDDAYKANVGLTELMIEIANAHNAILIHISTDAVYKDMPIPKNELSSVAPLSVYAKTKFIAEEKVKEKSNKFYIIRTNLYGYNILSKYSLAEWVYNNLKDGKSISGFEDVFFSPILVNHFAEALYHLFNQSAQTNSILNIGSINSISKYDFAVNIANNFSLDSALVKKVSVDNFGLLAPRSKNMAMDCHNFQTLYGYSLPSVEEGLQDFYQLHVQGYNEKLKKFNLN